MIFARERGRLWNIARRHYFEIFLNPVDRLPRFVSGWYPPTRDIIDEFRWMGLHSVTELPPTSGPSLLRIVFNVPRELLGATVTVTFNGQVLERIHLANDEVSRDYRVDPLPHAPNRLDLDIDRTLDRDGRREGLRLRFLSLGRA